MRRTQKYFLYPSFELGNDEWQIANIDPHGEWIRLRPARNVDGKEKVVEGEPAPDWQATTVSDDKIGSEKLKGNYVLLDFWGSWCGPCIEEIPLLQKAYQQFKDKNFEIIGFAYVDGPSLDKAMEEYEILWPQVLDEKGDYSSKFLVRGYPTYYLIGPNGNILEMGNDLRGDKLISTLEQYLE